ncbi:ubiquinone biosynthesis accessory factor UbiJ [Luteimonas vadosa]|uniref:Ubiquinone biosynthesis accessory factor UbiJ n=1 Tax=Luteimonas vadosa TaxID=1165507 RepID=A0ABP9DYF0_9GAMM
MPEATAHPFDDLKPAAGRALEAALNRALALDTDTRAQLARLEGRRIALHLASPPLALQLTVDDGRLRVGPVPGSEAAPDLAVRSTLGGLLSQVSSLLGGRGPRAGAPPAGRLRIEGDAELAQQLQRLATGFDPDWQQPFAAVFGDVIGVQVANGVASALRQARVAGAELAGTAAEYVVEESRDVVGRDELNAFHDDVDAVRDDVDRLAARVARLQRAGGEDAR